MKRLLIALALAVLAVTGAGPAQIALADNSNGGGTNGGFDGK